MEGLRKEGRKEGSRSAVPATKSARQGSQSAVPVTKSARRASQSAVPVRNSAHQGSQSAVPVTKSTRRGSQSAAPATKSARRGSPSAVSATKSALRGLQSAAPATKSTLRSSPSAVPATKSAQFSSLFCHGRRVLCRPGNLWFFRRGRHFWHHGARFGQGKWKMCTSRFTKCCACPCHKSENEPHVQKSRFTAPVTTMSKVPRLPRKLHFDVKQLTKSRV